MPLSYFCSSFFSLLFFFLLLSSCTLVFLCCYFFLSYHFLISCIQFFLMLFIAFSICIFMKHNEKKSFRSFAVIEKNVSWTWIYEDFVRENWLFMEKMCVNNIESWKKVDIEENLIFEQTANNYINNFKLNLLSLFIV